MQSSIFGNVGLFSYGTALLAYSMLVILAFISRRTPQGIPMLVASALTAVWAATATVSTLLPLPKVLVIQLAEVARNAAWIFVLLRLLRTRLDGTEHLLNSKHWTSIFVIGTAAIMALLWGVEAIDRSLPFDIDFVSVATFGTWLGMSILGLLLLELYFRSSLDDELWGIKHFCLGVGILFSYDFFMYAEGLLFHFLDATLWQARGIVTTMSAILIAVSVSRTDQTQKSEIKTGFNPSRHIAFHSLTLMGSGIYLVTMALAAYFIQFLGGSWGGVLQIAFLCGAGLVLLLLLFSGRIRASIRVWLSKNFFSYKYDYRLEWLQFTQTLASGENDIPHNITRAVANLAKSPAGILWSRFDDNAFSITANWGMARPQGEVELGDLPAWLKKHEWIIDLDEWRRAPDIYRGLELPQSLTDIPRGRIVIPLLFGDKLQGILLLHSSDFQKELNWEDRDLLKVAGRQAASHLAQYQVDQALMESRQFETFNRLSAYVIHDLKNILAQLSLMVSNAQKHKHNPEFIDDMVDTVSNTVDRMTRLVAQLRGGTQQMAQLEFNLEEALEEVIDRAALRSPAPQLVISDKDLKLNCNREQLQTVFSHLIQNAQEATGTDGEIRVRLIHSNGSAIVEIEDNGIGMDDAFIQQRLFKPFDSTKGLTGMGIGVFESRDFIRGLGGDISVHSTPGKGSQFRIRIPTGNTAAPTSEAHDNIKDKVSIQ